MNTERISLEESIARIKTACREWAEDTDIEVRRRRLETISREADRHPRALHSVLTGFKQSAPDWSDDLIDILEATAEDIVYAPGSHYRSKSNPNPDGFTLDEIEGRATDRFTDPLPALCVKVHEDFSTVDFESLREELGLSMRLAPATPGGPPLVLCREWIEARFDLDGKLERAQEYWDGPHAFARENGWQFATERAEALFAETPYDVKVQTAGRQGGWAVLTGLPSLRDLKDCASMLDELDSFEDADGTGQTIEIEDRIDEIRDEIGDLTRADWDAFLSALSEWIEDGKACVQDFSRQVAWQCGANVFECEAEQWAKDTEDAEIKAARVAKVQAAHDALSEAVEGGKIEDEDSHRAAADLLTSVLELVPRLATRTRDDASAGPSAPLAIDPDLQDKLRASAVSKVTDGGCADHAEDVEKGEGKVLDAGDGGYWVPVDVWVGTDEIIK